MTYIPPGARCNVCGVIKGVTNNWYIVHLVNEGVHIYQFSMGEVALGIPCVCGEACLLKFISKHLSVIYPPSYSEAEAIAVAVDEMERHDVSKLPITISEKAEKLVNEFEKWGKSEV